MDCCGLSSTGLKNVDANDITADNITIISFLSSNRLWAYTCENLISPLASKIYPIRCVIIYC